MGLLSYAMAWCWHDRAQVGGIGWSRLSSWQRRLLRLGEGRAHLSAVTLEVWALLMLTAGIVAQLADIDPPTRRLLVNGPWYLIIAVVAVWAILAGRDLARRRR